jgi:uncharacterized protein YjbJ (UPF0337 family)
MARVPAQHCRPDPLSHAVFSQGTQANRWPLCDSTQTGGKRSPTVHHSFSAACRPFPGLHFFFQEQVMIVNKDQIKGRVREAEGKAKEVAGKMVGNEKLELKGNVQRALGQAQAKFGDIKQNMKGSKKGA